MRLAASVVGLLLSALACSSSDDDGGKKASSEPTLAFRSATPPAGASVTLRAKPPENGKLVVELVGHQLTDVYAVVIRLKFDAALVSFTSFTSGPAFAAPDEVVLADAKTPGLMVGTVSLKGKQPGVVADGAVLGVVTLALTQEKPSKLDFVTSRSAVVASANGAPLPAIGWAGGELVLE